MARRVEGDRVREVRADVGHAEDVDEELAQLVDLRRDRRDALRQARVDAAVGRQAGDERVIATDHRRARARRRDDGVIAGERVDEPLDERDARVLVARVEVHLAAAGLLGRELDVVAEPPQQRTIAWPTSGNRRSL